MEERDDRIDPEKLKAAMARKGIRGQRGLAKALGHKNASTVSPWFHRKNTPSGAYIDALCKLLDVTPAYLFGKKEDPAQRRAQMLDAVRAELGRRVAELVEAIAAEPAAEERDALALRFLTELNLLRQGWTPPATPATSPPSTSTPAAPPATLEDHKRRWPELSEEDQLPPPAPQPRPRPRRARRPSGGRK